MRWPGGTRPLTWSAIPLERLVLPKLTAAAPMSTAANATPAGQQREPLTCPGRTWNRRSGGGPLLLECPLDRFALLGAARPEIHCRRFQPGVAEQGLHLGRIGAALAQPGGVSVPQPVWPQWPAAELGVRAHG